MTIRYCDLDGTWSNVAGELGSEQGGPGGLLAIFRGTGTTNIMAPGDTVYVKGTNVKTTRLVKIKVTAHLWSLGDVVKDNNTGSEWTGVICEVLDVDNLIVELDIGFQESDITDGNGINNTTAVDTDAIVSANDYYLRINVAGDKATGHITIQGRNSDYSAVSLVILDAEDTGGTNVLYGLRLEVNADYVKLSYIGTTNAAHTGIYATNYSTQYVILDHCKMFNNQSNGIYMTGLYLPILIHVIIENNGAIGLFGGINAVLLFSRIRNNGSTGLSTANNDFIIYGCLLEGNTSDNLFLNVDRGRIFNSVLDGSNAGSGVKITSLVDNIIMIGNRFTNNNQYGIEMEATIRDSNYEDYNTFYGNGVSSILNILPGANSIDDSINDGYVTGTWNVADGADLDSTEINLFWDEE